MENTKEKLPQKVVIEETPQREFYEKLREQIKHRLGKAENKIGKKGIDLLLLAPDLFVLLYRLVKDPRISTRQKIILGAVVAYWILPTDILPEMLFGAIGYLDDILITFYVIDTLFADTDREILLEHWAGDPNIIKNIQLYSKKVKEVLLLIGGNIEQKAVHFAEIILKSGKKPD